MQLRALTTADAEASARMSFEAFGERVEPGQVTFGEGLVRWGLFDGGTLLAKANDRDYRCVIGGREIPTAGVAGVAVAPEARGRGLARRVMSLLLAEARDRGAPISTLFRTAPALYRSLGYEQVAELTYGRLPTAALRGLRVPAAVTARRATAADLPAVRAVYAEVVAAGSCLLTRTGPQFPATDPELLAAFDGITVVEDASGDVVGYASWDRGAGIGADAAITVTDLLGLTGDATTALLAVLASFDAVAPTLRIRTSGTDPLQYAVPGAGWSVRAIEPYMLRVVDLVAAVAARGWPPGLRASVELSLLDPVCPWNSGDHRLVFADGRAAVEPGHGNGPSVTPQGLAVLFAGSVPTAVLRRSGMLTGGSKADDQVLDAAVAGPRPAILDAF